MLAGTFVRDRALNPLANPSRLQRLWLCEAVRLREEQAGLLDDSAIVRQLRHEALDLPQRIEQRALRLAARDGQAGALQHAVQGARLALLLLAVLAVAGGFSMALAALGDGLRPVNLLWALGSLLGLHLLSLLLWLLVTACLAQGPAPSGQLWLWLSARLARDAQAAQLAPSLLLLLQSQGLNRWLFAVLSHTLWLLLLLGALAGLLLLLASRHYGFVWKAPCWTAATLSVASNCSAGCRLCWVSRHRRRRSSRPAAARRWSMRPVASYGRCGCSANC